jgi:hypothetical protein
VTRILKVLTNRVSFISLRKPEMIYAVSSGTHLRIKYDSIVFCNRWLEEVSSYGNCNKECTEYFHDFNSKHFSCVNERPILGMWFMPTTVPAYTGKSNVSMWGLVWVSGRKEVKSCRLPWQLNIDGPNKNLEPSDTVWFYSRSSFQAVWFRYRSYVWN